MVPLVLLLDSSCVAAVIVADGMLAAVHVLFAGGVAVAVAGVLLDEVAALGGSVASTV